MRRPKTSMKGDIFHILNRGVEKRKIFLAGEDYLRFVHNLCDFNDTENAILSYFNRRKQFSDVRRPKKEELVDVLCWCLMPNHPHVLVREKVDGGVSIFSKKIIGGYTKYFNEKNERSGVLFQGRSKIIRVIDESHFIHLPFYIMANPIELIEPGWREKGIQDLKKVVKFLENYKYSSFLDLSGEENFSYLINKDLFYQLFSTGRREFKKEFIDWLKGYRKEDFIDFKEFE